MRLFPVQIPLIFVLGDSWFICITFVNSQQKWCSLTDDNKIPGVFQGKNFIFQDKTQILSQNDIKCIFATVAVTEIESI